MQTQTAITLTGVTKQFGKGSQITTALDGINLSIQDGEFVSLIGPSGCGKTTLLRILAGLTNQTAGEVTTYGSSPQWLQCQRKLGVAFQRSALEPSRTALSNVELTLEVTGSKHPLAEAKKLLIAFGLSASMHKYPHELSGGMQQRVNIAAALVHNPSLLLLDEPFGALDLITRDMMAEWLSNVLAQESKTVVFVTHSDEEAVLLSDRIVIMSPSPGRVYQEIAIKLPRPRNRVTKMSTDFLQTVAQVRRVLYEVVYTQGGEHEASLFGYVP